MKKKLSILATFIFLFTLTIQAQDEGTGDRIFKKFKVDVSFGYAIPQVSAGAGGTKAGALFAVEPKYAVLDELAVGLRIEAAVTARIDNNNESGNAKANASYLATGDYYFSNNKFRPFLGAGAGVFTFASVDFDSNTTIEDIPTNSRFGFMARGGFEYGHLRVGAEYNFVGEKNGYFGLKLGVVIGGGRK
ncbi:MAG: outer membrane beta-barrel protein [Ginsengibacter sp.]